MFFNMGASFQGLTQQVTVIDTMVQYDHYAAKQTEEKSYTIDALIAPMSGRKQAFQVDTDRVEGALEMHTTYEKALTVASDEHYPSKIQWHDYWYKVIHHEDWTDFGYHWYMLERIVET